MGCSLGRVENPHAAELLLAAEQAPAMQMYAVVSRSHSITAECMKGAPQMRSAVYLQHAAVLWLASTQAKVFPMLVRCW